MKMFWKVLIGILVLFVVVAVVFQSIINNQICYDKGSSKAYFLKEYYLNNPDLFFNKTSFTIPDDFVVASYSESAKCGDSGTYSVKLDGKFKKVSQERFDEFISSYENGSLLVNINRWGPSGIYDVSLDKPVCGVTGFYREAPMFSNCVNVSK